MSSTTTTETKSLSPAPTTPHVQIPRGPTKTKLVFYAPPTDGSAPYDHNGRVPHGQLQQNYILEAHDATINDIRGREEQFDLNINGFAVVPNVQSKMTDFHQSGAIEDIYYPEVQQLLFDKLPGAKRIEIFDHTVRTSALNSKHQPVQRVHVDQTRESAEGRVRTAMGDEAEQLLGGRFRLINVWRPLNGPVLSSPLAVADSQSIPDEGLVMVEHRYPHRVGMTYSVKHTEGAKWYYWSGITNEERILLQIYDSQDGARTPHSAFEHAETKADWPARESIEVRALVFG